MKKLISMLVLACMLAALGASPVLAAEGLSVYSTSVASYTPTAYDPADTVAASISGGARIIKIAISTNDLTVAQTISFYENATSTTACTAKWSIDVDSITATADNQPIIIDFPGGSDYWYAKNVLARKSSASSTVRVTYWYK